MLNEPTKVPIGSPKRVLVLGATGMLGNAVFRFFGQSPDFQVFGSVRSGSSLRFLPEDLHSQVTMGVDVGNFDQLTGLFAKVKPDIVINCVGLIKQLAESDDPLEAIPINALLPHRLAQLCQIAGGRLVHMSTDCVFSGAKGMYVETDSADSKDLYGRSKYLGEVDQPHAITLRTSIIGHELNSAHSLVGWFLSQKGCVTGFNRAIFSGLPTVEIARIIRDHVVPYPELHGLYHVSAEPINKFNLLKLIAEEYERKIDIHPDDKLIINRSLDSTRFQSATGYKIKPWPELIRNMREFDCY